MEILVRYATLDDAGTIAGFNAAMAKETEGLTLDPARLAAGVRAILGDASKGFYLVAEAGGRVAGQTMITYEWSDWRNGVFWWIQSVYVDPEFRGRGVFQRLYRRLEEQARCNPGVCGLRLYVEEHNHRAQQTYQGLGMRKTSYEMYETDFVIGR